MSEAPWEPAEGAGHQRDNTHDQLQLAGQLGTMLLAQNEELEGKLAEATADNERMKATLVEVSHELQITRQDRLKMMDQIDALQRENLSLVTVASNRQSDVDAALAKVRGLEDNNSWLQKKCDELAEQLAGRLRDLDDAQRQVAEVRRANQELEAEKDARSSGKPAGHRSVAGAMALPSPKTQVALVEKELQSCQQKNIQLQRDLETKSTALSTLRQDLLARDQELASLRPKHDKLVEILKEQAEVVNSLRGEGYLRQDDAEDTAAAAGAAAAGRSDMYSDLTLRSERKRCEAMEKELKHLNGRYVKLVRILKIGRRKGTIKAQTLRPGRRGAAGTLPPPGSTLDKTMLLKLQHRTRGRVHSDMSAINSVEDEDDLLLASATSSPKTRSRPPSVSSVPGGMATPVSVPDTAAPDGEAATAPQAGTLPPSCVPGGSSRATAPPATTVEATRGGSGVAGAAAAGTSVAGLPSTPPTSAPAPAPAPAASLPPCDSLPGAAPPSAPLPAHGAPVAEPVATAAGTLPAGGSATRRLSADVAAPPSVPPSTADGVHGAPAGRRSPSLRITTGVVFDGQASASHIGAGGSGTGNDAGEGEGSGGGAASDGGRSSTTPAAGAATAEDEAKAEPYVAHMSPRVGPDAHDDSTNVSGLSLTELHPGAASPGRPPRPAAFTPETCHPAAVNTAMLAELTPADMVTPMPAMFQDRLRDPVPSPMSGAGGLSWQSRPTFLATLRRLVRWAHSDLLNTDAAVLRPEWDAEPTPEVNAALLSSIVADCTRVSHQLKAATTRDTMSDLELEEEVLLAEEMRARRRAAGADGQPVNGTSAASAGAGGGSGGDAAARRLSSATDTTDDQDPDPHPLQRTHAYLTCLSLTTHFMRTLTPRIAAYVMQKPKSPLDVEARRAAASATAGSFAVPTPPRLPQAGGASSSTPAAGGASADRASASSATAGGTATASGVAAASPPQPPPSTTPTVTPSSLEASRAAAAAAAAAVAPASGGSSGSGSQPGSGGGRRRGSKSLLTRLRRSGSRGRSNTPGGPGAGTEPVQLAAVVKSCAPLELEARLSGYLSNCVDRALTQWCSTLMTVARLAHTNQPMAETWVPDHNASGCRSCSSEFSPFNRRHHCRACGDLYCSKCSAHQMDYHRLRLRPLPHPTTPDLKRVCSECYLSLKPLAAQVASK